MAFNTIESSNYGGRRIGLYHFRWGQKHWYYTSADRIIEFDDGVDWPGQEPGPKQYLPVAISDGGVNQGGEQAVDFEVTVPPDNPVAALFRVSPPAGRVYLKVRRMHMDDDEAPLFWSGAVSNVKPKSQAGIVMTGKSSITLIKKRGLRLTMSRQCPHTLYDRQCQVPLADWEYGYTIESVVGNLVTLTTELPEVTSVAGPAEPELGFFTGGIFAWEVEPGTFDQRMIETQVTLDSFRIFGRGDGLSAGMSLLLYPGCDRTTGANGCGRFANIDNYGGHEYIPGKSPFDGTPVF